MMGSYQMKGVTLAEVVLALGVLALVGLTIVGVFTKLMGAQSKSSHETVGRLLIETVAERATLAGEPNFGTTKINEWQTETVYLHNSDAPVKMSYRIKDPVPLRATQPTNPMGKLWFLPIELKWWSDDVRVGTGKTSVETSRVVYLEE
jgi:hypothetical protein